MRITIIYLIVGSLWILLSDNLVQKLFKDSPEAILTISLIKGWFYVLVTALMIFSLTFAALRRNRETRQKIDEAHRELARRQTLLQALINSIPDFIFYKDIQGANMGCNKPISILKASRRKILSVKQTGISLNRPEPSYLFLTIKKFFAIINLSAMRKK